MKKNWHYAAVATAVLVLLLFGVWLFWPKPKPVAIERTEPVSVTVRAPEPSPKPPLSIWCFAGAAEADRLKDRIAAFQRAEGETVSPIIFGNEATYHKERAVALLTGGAADVLWVDALEVESLYQKSALGFCALDSDDTGKWLEPAIVPFQRAIKMVAYPCEFSVFLLYYNKALFDRVGCAYPSSFWKWHVFKDLARGLTESNADGDTDIYGLEFPPSLAYWNVLSAQSGAPIYDKNAWHLGDNPDTTAVQTAALQFFFDAHKIPALAAPSTGDNGEYFLAGRAAMVVAGCEMLGKLEKQKSVRWGITTLPTDQSKATALEAGGWAVFARSAHPAEAAKLAHYLAQAPLHDGRLPAYLPAANLTGNGEIVYKATRFAIPPWQMERAVELTRQIDQKLTEELTRNDHDPKALMDWVNRLVAAP